MLLCIAHVNFIVNSLKNGQIILNFIAKLSIALKYYLKVFLNKYLFINQNTALQLISDQFLNYLKNSDKWNLIGRNRKRKNNSTALKAQNTVTGHTQTSLHKHAMHAPLYTN